MKQYFSFLFTTMVVIIIGFIGLIEGTITLLASEQNPQTPIVNREKVLYTSEVLSVTQIEAEIIVKNISKFSIAVRISWDGHDPNGIGKGKDSSLHSNVAPDMKISREFKDHTSVQLWAWNRSGQLIDSCNIRISTSIGNILYTGSVLLVGQTGSKIVIENISSSPVAIRISWDGNDPHGFGKGEDSVLHNNVSPTMRISQNFNKHTSVQIWAWDLSGKLKDACDKPLIGISTSAPGQILYSSAVLSVSQTESEIIVENISPSPVAIRISWDGSDPNGEGKGADSFLDNNVLPHKRVTREFKDHPSVQIWVWDSSGKLIDSCDILLH